MTTQNTLYLKTLESSLASTHLFPAWGKVPSLSVQNFQKPLQEAFSIDNLILSTENSQWMKRDEALKQAGSLPYLMHYTLSPVNGNLGILIARADADQLISNLITKEPASPFQDSELQKGFLEAMMMETIYTITQSPDFLPFTLHHSKDTIACENVYSTKVNIEIGGKIASLYILISEDLSHELKAHYEAEPLQLKHLQNPETIQLPVTLTGGHVVLNFAEWNTVEEGDVILLDYNSFSPSTKKGHGTLKIHDTPLFQLKIKEDQLKVLDYAYQTEGISMTDDNMSESDPNDPLGELFSDPESATSIPGFDSMDEPDVPTTESPTPPKNEPLAQEEVDQEKTASSVKEVTNDELIKPDEVPLEFSVQLSKFEISLKELMQLKPGDTIPLAVKPENGIKLILNRKCVAHGELIQIGDAVGVKVTSLTPHSN